MNPIYARRQKKGWERPSLRILLFAALMAVALLCLVARLAVLQLIDGARYRAAAQENQIRLIRVSAPRGLIYDRSGHALARSRPSFVVGVIPSEIGDLGSEIARLSETIGVPQATLLQRLFHHHGINYTSFAQIEANEPYGPIVLAVDLPVPIVARLSEILTDLPGVDLEVQPIRDYPNGDLGSHILGYVGEISQDEYARLRSRGYSLNDVVGKDGLEAEYDAYLRGQPGGERIEVDASGQVVRGARFPQKPATPGDALLTSIDWRLQRIVEEALARGIASWGHGQPLSGAVVAEDPYTGEILALASFPNFDPNDFVTGNSANVEADLTSPLEPLFDRAIAAATPTGSTFKMVTGSAALTERVIGVNQVVYDSGAWNCGGYLARDIAAGGLGDTTFVPALAASSDAYFYRLSWYLGNERLRKYALAFGLDKRSGIDLPGEGEGNWPTNAWMQKTYGVPLEPSDVCVLGIGQGAMQATPLQMTNVASAVINGGTLYRPHVVLQIRAPNGSIVETFRPHVIRQVPVTQAALSAVRAGMARVTDPGGTAYGLAIDGLPFSGKTGTVETSGGHGPNTTWFICWAPTDHPKFALAVYIDRSGGYGASVAAPIARAILVKYFRKRG
ncbi:MAG TPA: penicillin-binding protein 2 [Candidatus Tyrphobacter sp.]